MRLHHFCEACPPIITLKICHTEARDSFDELHVGLLMVKVRCRKKILSFYTSSSDWMLLSERLGERLDERLPSFAPVFIRAREIVESSLQAEAEGYPKL